MTASPLPRFAALGVLLLALLTPLVPAQAAGSFNQQMASILEHYQVIESALVADTFPAPAVQAARQIAKEAPALDLASIAAKHREHMKDVPQQLEAAARLVQKAKDLAGAREAFKQLSRPMVMWASMAPPTGVSVMYCPMVQASWLQPGVEVQNPYVDAGMRGCGQLVGSEKQQEEHGGDHRGEMKKMEHGGDEEAAHHH